MTVHACLTWIVQYMALANSYHQLQDLLASLAGLGTCLARWFQELLGILLGTRHRGVQERRIRLAMPDEADDRGGCCSEDLFTALETMVRCTKERTPPRPGAGPGGRSARRAPWRGARRRWSGWRRGSG